MSACAPADTPAPLAPGAVIGVLGGGQLGRMLTLAAARLGYRCHVYSPDDDAPAAQVTNRATVASYDDEPALAAFARACDVITYEFENIPSACTTFLAERACLRPSAFVLAICQDRLKEKDFLARIGAPVAPYAVVRDPAGLHAALTRIGRPAVLKTARLGYDGKGQTTIADGTDEAAAWAALDAEGGSVGVLEAFVDFTAEVSVIIARGADGSLAAFDPVQNIHENHILKRTLAPAPLPAAILDGADRLAREIACALDLVGVLAVEMFVHRDGRLLVNELAPRPHNSGHWTIDACACSQFEQCVRAIAGLPLGSTARFADAVMDNLLGDDAARWLALLAEPGARLHLYGKAEMRPGRKMGHVTRLAPLTSASLSTATAATMSP